MASDQLEIVQELLQEQLDIVEEQKKKIEHLNEELASLRINYEHNRRLTQNLKRPLIPLVEQLLATLQEQNRIEAKSNAKSEKLKEMIQARLDSKRPPAV